MWPMNTTPDAPAARPFYVVYSRAMAAPMQGRTSPSAAKPAKVVADWRAHGIEMTLVDPAPVTIEDFSRVHHRPFVESVLSLRSRNGFDTISRDVADSLPYTSGSMLTAARLAIRERTAVCSPSSGFHHARWSRPAGFCTFNGLMVTARALIDEGVARRVAIIDCDEHYGDGTDEILERLGNPESIHHFTAGASFDSPDQAPEFFERLTRELHAVKGFDVVLYQAGADPHINDPLGGWLTTEQLRARDALVFETAHALGLPLVWNLAGGYQRDRNGGITPVLEIHRNTALEHRRVFCQG
jgi:acetoin utilization deacetylase AcuC-like enzyme